MKEELKRSRIALTISAISLVFAIIVLILTIVLQ